MDNTSRSISENHSIHSSQECMFWAQMQLLTEMPHSRYPLRDYKSTEFKQE